MKQLINNIIEFFGVIIGLIAGGGMLALGIFVVKRYIQCHSDEEHFKRNLTIIIGVAIFFVLFVPNIVFLLFDQLKIR